jgi:hypothetical protein
MENKSEQLFNSLIKRWRVSFRDYDIAEFNQIGNTFVAINYDGKVIGQFSFRQIVSKESWLWQFVCENGMVKEWHKHERILDPTFWEWWADCKRQEHDWNYWYRVIESALCDEDKLEEFLLSNIKVWNGQL